MKLIKNIYDANRNCLKKSYLILKPKFKTFGYKNVYFWVL